mmetsp:Transcript_24738/g.77568  ORF Transcript_24738/g.77568 Transcript_24738/m.77568 type:complete len:260 (+) Transcript_24738:195-974(+)
MPARVAASHTWVALALALHVLVKGVHEVPPVHHVVGGCAPERPLQRLQLPLAQVDPRPREAVPELGEADAPALQAIAVAEEVAQAHPAASDDLEHASEDVLHRHARGCRGRLGSAARGRPLREARVVAAPAHLLAILHRVQDLRGGGPFRGHLERLAERLVVHVDARVARRLTELPHHELEVPGRLRVKVRHAQHALEDRGRHVPALLAVKVRERRAHLQAQASGLEGHLPQHGVEALGLLLAKAVRPAVEEVAAVSLQ